MSDSQRLQQLVDRAIAPLSTASGDDAQLHIDTLQQVSKKYTPLLENKAVDISEFHYETLEHLVAQAERAPGLPELLHSTHTLISAFSALPGDEPEIHIPPKPQALPGDEPENNLRLGRGW